MVIECLRMSPENRESCCPGVVPRVLSRLVGTTRSTTRHPGILKDHRSGKYVVRVRDRHGRQRSRSFEKLSYALEWQGQRRSSSGDSIPKKSSTLTFNEYALSIPAMHPEWAEGTLSSWHSRRKRLDKAGLGELRLSEITAGDIQRALAKLRSRGLSETTIDGTRGLVTAVYRHAMADELIDSSPTDRLPFTTRAPRSSVDDDAALTPGEVAELLESLPGRLRALAVTMVSTGLRPAEAAGLTADRLDLLHGTLRVDRQLRDKLGPDKLPTFGTPKTRSSKREIDLPDELIGILEAHLAEYGLGSGGLVFAGPRLGQPMTRGRLSEAWRTYTDGITFADDVRGWHSLRHTYATTALAAGVPPNIVAANLGHKHAGVTLSVYSHDPRDARRESRNAVANALGIAVGK